ncbi:hypothetical protein Tco_1019887 [Tanacetum coccineum]|uniref:Uncharacterized protein n=1 Tax=Tanacetum coccineum TaxID=301880 RepID=A0ABQ5G0P9_9ASTR
MTRLQQVDIDSKRFLEFFDCPGSRQGVEDLRELEDKQPEEKTNTNCLVKEQKKEYPDWVEDQDGSPSSAIGFKTPIDMLGVFGWLASIKKRMLEPVKVKCIFLGSLEVLHGFEFEVEPLGDHTFEVEPQENVDQGAGLQEVQTQDLMDYQLARDRGFEENQMVCTRLDIASADVGMLNKFDRGLQTDVQHMEALSTTEVGYMTFTKAWKNEIWLKGLLTESRYKQRLVAGIATRALVKAG